MNFAQLQKVIAGLKGVLSLRPSQLAPHHLAEEMARLIERQFDAWGLEDHTPPAIEITLTEESERDEVRRWLAEAAFEAELRRQIAARRGDLRMPAAIKRRYEIGKPARIEVHRLVPLARPIRLQWHGGDYTLHRPKGAPVTVRAGRGAQRKTGGQRNDVIFTDDYPFVSRSAFELEWSVQQEAWHLLIERPVMPHTRVHRGGEVLYLERSPFRLEHGDLIIVRNGARPEKLEVTFTEVSDG